MEFDDKTWKKVDHNAPRELVVDTIKAIISQAKTIPIEKLVACGDYHNTKNRYPQTIGERIADALSYILASQDWVDGESEPILDEMLGIVSQLDIDVSDIRNWQDLFLVSENLE
jgi:hypothetical protein